MSVVIISAMRTPVGSFQGNLSSLSATKLGGVAIKAALDQIEIEPRQIDECIMGEVLTAGVGQAPSRQAAIYAGLPSSVPCVTVNKVCGSGLHSVINGYYNICLERSRVVIAGGQESMSQSPHLLMGSRQGYRMGHSTLTDSMIHDGLWDPYNQFHMGVAAELCVKEHSISREQQDEFTIESYRRAQKAQQSGWFKNQIVPVEIASRTGTTLVHFDEEPEKAKFDKISQLKPAFDAKGTITAANSSKINDGAAALVLMNEKEAEKRKIKPLARIVSEGYFAQDPKWFTTAPAQAINRALNRAHLKISDIDLWEINEAFSVVTLVAIKELSLDPSKVNVHGGAVAIGHPIGASGARILVTLIHALHTHNKRYGVASLCIGGGEGIALIVERL